MDELTSGNRQVGSRVRSHQALVFGVHRNVSVYRKSCHADRSEQNDPKAIRQFAWIPQAMLLAFAAADAPVELR